MVLSLLIILFEDAIFLDVVLFVWCLIIEVWFEDFALNLSGLTQSNYSELSHLYEKYKTQGGPNFSGKNIVFFLLALVMN